MTDTERQCVTALRVHMEEVFGGRPYVLLAYPKDSKRSVCITGGALTTDDAAELMYDMLVKITNGKYEHLKAQAPKPQEN